MAFGIGRSDIAMKKAAIQGNLNCLSLRQNDVGTSFTRGDAILPKGHDHSTDLRVLASTVARTPTKNPSASM
jgi:hypothetical protein